jgi:hypothetical protein
MPALMRVMAQLQLDIALNINVKRKGRAGAETQHRSKRDKGGEVTHGKRYRARFKLFCVKSSAERPV